MRFLIPLLLLTTPVMAQDKTGPAIAALETGVICPPESTGTRPAPDTVAGVTNVITDEPPFVSTVNRVPAVMGIGFGAKAMSQSAFGIDNVTMTITHPPMGTQKQRNSLSKPALAASIHQLPSISSTMTTNFCPARGQ